MNIRIIKPDSILYEGEATLVQMPGIDGKFELLNNHAPIISALTKGTIRIVVEDNSEKTFEIRGGVLKGENNNFVLMVQ